MKSLAVSALFFLSLVFVIMEQGKQIKQLQADLIEARVDQRRLDHVEGRSVTHTEQIDLLFEICNRR